MTDTATPVIRQTWSARRPNSILRSIACGTPFRTPDRRRFGPLGASWHATGPRPNSRMSTSTPVSRAARTFETGDDVPSRTEEITQRTELEEEDIMKLTKKVWKVFRLTPLHNFDNKKTDLRDYSKNLSSHVAAENKRGTFIDTSEPGDATVKLYQGLDVGIDDNKALHIEIKGKARNKEMEKVVSEAILFSTDLEYNPLKPSLQSDFTYFSSMLIRGPESLSQTIQNWLEMQFDCKVVTQTFTSHELSFMAAMFTGFNEVHKPCELVYGVPNEVEGLSNIDYSTKADDCLRLWNRIRDSESDSFTSEEAQKFISGLEGHFYEIFNIKLNAMPLLSIGTSVAFVGRDGKIKIYSRSVENVLKICRHLTDLALDQLKMF